MQEKIGCEQGGVKYQKFWEKSIRERLAALQDLQKEVIRFAKELIGEVMSSLTIVIAKLKAEENLIKGHFKDFEHTISMQEFFKYSDTWKCNFSIFRSSQLQAEIRIFLTQPLKNFFEISEQKITT